MFHETPEWNFKHYNHILGYPKKEQGSQHYQDGDKECFIKF